MMIINVVTWRDVTKDRRQPRILLLCTFCYVNVIGFGGGYEWSNNNKKKNALSGGRVHRDMLFLALRLYRILGKKIKPMTKPVFDRNFELLRGSLFYPAVVISVVQTYNIFSRELNILLLLLLLHVNSEIDTFMKKYRFF